MTETTTAANYLVVCEDILHGDGRHEEFFTGHDYVDDHGVEQQLKVHVPHGMGILEACAKLGRIQEYLRAEYKGLLGPLGDVDATEGGRA